MYTGADGAVTTYRQPPESLGPITSVPYTARVPASSNCTPFESAKVYTGLPEPTGVTTTGSASGLSTSRTGTGSAGAAASTTTSGAKERMAVSGVAVVGVVLSALFFA